MAQIFKLLHNGTSLNYSSASLKLMRNMYFGSRSVVFVYELLKLYSNNSTFLAKQINKNASGMLDFINGFEDFKTLFFPQF